MISIDINNIINIHQKLIIELLQSSSQQKKRIITIIFIAIFYELFNYLLLFLVIVTKC